MHEVDPQHPDYITVRRATAKMFKSAKKERRLREAGDHRATPTAR